MRKFIRALIPSRDREVESTQEGVYSGPGIALHYALDDGTRTLCGRSVERHGLHRWSSQWSLTDVADRCKRCDRLVGPRGDERHGPPTAADLMLFGVIPPGLSRRSQEALRDHFTRSQARFTSAAPPPGVTFRDPPFELATDPQRIRGTLESPFDRVVNEVYARQRPRLRWHRVARFYPRPRDPSDAPYGRGFHGACNFPVRDFDPASGRGDLVAAELTTERPPAAELCRSCLASERRWWPADGDDGTRKDG